MDSNALQITIPGIIAALLVLGAGMFDMLPPWYVLATYFGIAAFGVLAINLPFYQDTLRHKEWLRKRQSKSTRMTEVLVPPPGMGEFARALEGAKKDRKQLPHLTRHYLKRAVWRKWLSIGLVLGLFLIFFGASFSFITSLLTPIAQLMHEDIYLRDLASRNALYMAFIAAVVLASSADAMAASAQQVASTIQGEASRVQPIKRFTVSLIAVFAGIAVFSAFTAVDLYTAQQTQTQQEARKVETKTEMLKREQQEMVEKQNFLAKENADLSRKMQEKTSEIEALKASLKKAEQQAKGYKNKADKLAQDLAQKERSLKEVKQSLASATAEKENITQELRESIKSLESEKQMLQGSLNEAQSALQDLEARLEITEGTLKATQEELGQVNAELEHWQTPLSLSEIDVGENIQLVDEGRRLRLGTDLIFRPEQADQLSADAGQIMATLAEGLKEIQKANPGSWVIVMAHSNALPPQSGNFESKLALTALQATAIKQALEDEGLQSVMASGFGFQKELDTRLVEEALKKNNRIEIAVVLMPF